MKIAIIAAAGLAGALALGGCSSSSSSTSESASPTASPSGSAGMIGPIMVPAGQTDVEATVGRTIVFDVGSKPGRWKIETDNTEVLKVTPGGKEGDATFNPGAEALAVGTATVTLTDKKSSLDAMVYNVTVTE